MKKATKLIGLCFWLWLAKGENLFQLFPAVALLETESERESERREGKGHGPELQKLFSSSKTLRQNKLNRLPPASPYSIVSHLHQGSLTKGKALYNWPPSTNRFGSASLYIKNIF